MKILVKHLKANGRGLFDCIMGGTGVDLSCKSAGLFFYLTSGLKMP